ncbi:MAG: pitrilysin family protein [Bacteroidales bacterium]
MVNNPHSLPKVDFSRDILPNGMTVIVVPRQDTGLVAVNLMYRVGSRDEDPGMTGLAHLMEHLMFSGTDHYPAFDLPLTRVGGMNNAFTTQDLTNYYIVIPAEDFRLAFDLEADRLKNLRLDQASIDVQKSVVIEEFRQRYLNQPYGDLNHLLCAAAFREHPYRWPTIGLIPEHIEAVKADDLFQFYRRHYNPANLILAVAGNVERKQVTDLAGEFFGSIPAVVVSRPELPSEYASGRGSKTVVQRNVPTSMLLMAFPVTGSAHPHFPGFGFLADIIGQGVISRLHSALVRDQKVFTKVSAGLTGTLDPGLITISGMLQENISSESALEMVMTVIDDFITSGPTASEMKSVLNGMVTSVLFKRGNVMNLALEIAATELESDASRINTLLDEYMAVTPELIVDLAKSYLSRDNLIEVHYLKG